MRSSNFRFERYKTPNHYFLVSHGTDVLCTTAPLSSGLMSVNLDVRLLLADRVLRSSSGVCLLRLDDGTDPTSSTTKQSLRLSFFFFERSRTRMDSAGTILEEPQDESSIVGSTSLCVDIPGRTANRGSISFKYIYIHIH